MFSSLQTAGGFTAPNSESQQAADLAAATFGHDQGDVVVLYSSDRLTVTDPAFKSAVTSTLAALPGSKVTSAATFWSTGSRQFVSADGHETYAVLQLAGADDAAKIKTFDSIENQLSAPGLTEHAGGQIPSEGAINKQVTKDIGRAEGLSMPVLLILLLIIFGGLAAASLPLAIGGIAILGSFTALRALTLFTPVSIYSINITTILGLGLAIDYGLFMVGRFREELTRSRLHRAGGGPYRGHGRPHRRGLRRHRGDRAGQPDAVPDDVPALDGLRRRGHRPGRHAGRADPAARAAGRARPEGQRAADPPPGAAPRPGWPTRPAAAGTGWPAA